MTAEAVGGSFVHVTSDYLDHMRMERDPRGDRSPTCKIAGIAYTGFESCPCHYPSELRKCRSRSCHNAALREILT